MRRASGLARSPASVRRWQLLWSPALLIPRPSDRDGLLGLGRARVEAELERGKHKLGKQGESLIAACSRPARSPDPLCQDPWHRASALAHRAASVSTDQSCCDRARQQDCPHGVDHDGPGWRYKEPIGLAAKTLSSRIKKPDIRQQLWPSI